MNYICEPVLNSELLLFNNSKLLKNNPNLRNEVHLTEILELREEYQKLDADNSMGLQKKKRDIRNRIRDLSVITYTDRDPNIFGEMALMIIEHTATRPNFSGYTYIDEMKSLAVEHITKYTWKFDTYRQSEITGQFVSAFTYISTIVFNAFKATIKKYQNENEKAKQDFLEHQKLFHRDPNQSTIEPNHSEIEKVVKFTNIDNTLFELIQKITLDVNDILVLYPEEYKIDMSEYNQIINYTTENNFNISLQRIIKVDIPVSEITVDIKIEAEEMDTELFDESLIDIWDEEDLSNS